MVKLFGPCSDTVCAGRTGEHKNRAFPSRRQHSLCGLDRQAQTHGVSESAAVAAGRDRASSGHMCGPGGAWA